jgi:Tfp pilus assembly protein PilF
MSYQYQLRCLPALALVAALALGSRPGLSETRTQVVLSSIQGYMQVTPQSQAISQPAASQQSGLPAVAGPPEPFVASPATPEEVADALMAQQHYQAAIEAYKNIPHRSADDWNKMGIAYQMMFNLVDAAHCYRASLKMNSKNPRVINNLGTIADAQKEFGNAERLYRKALKIDPRSALIFKNLGTNQLAQGKYKQGWDAYQAALEVDPNIFKNSSSPRVQNASSLAERGAMNYYMARGCVRAGMNDCAIEYLRMALNEGFTNPKKIEADIEFANLRTVPEFQKLLDEQRQQ